MKKPVLLALIVMALMLTPVNADFFEDGILYRERCYNTTHIALEYNYTAQVNSTNSTYAFYQLQECTDGCSADHCVTDYARGDLTGVTLVSGLFALALLFLSVRIDKSHGWMQLLFMLLGIVMVVNTLGMLVAVASANGAPENVLDNLDNQVWIMSTVLYFVAAIMMVSFLKQALEWLLHSSGRLKGGG